MRVRAACPGVVGGLIGQHIVPAQGQPGLAAGQTHGGVLALHNRFLLAQVRALGKRRRQGLFKRHRFPGGRRWGQVLPGGERRGLHGEGAGDAQSVFQRGRGQKHLILVLQECHLRRRQIRAGLIDVFGRSRSRRNLRLRHIHRLLEAGHLRPCHFHQIRRQ